MRLTHRVGTGYFQIEIFDEIDRLPEERLVESVFSQKCLNDEVIGELAFVDDAYGSWRTLNTVFRAIGAGSFFTFDDFDEIDSRLDVEHFAGLIIKHLCFLAAL